MKELWKKRYWTGFKTRIEVSAKVEGSSGWMRMADLIWTVRGGKGQQRWLEMKLLKFRCPAIPLSCCLQQGCS